MKQTYTFTGSITLTGELEVTNTNLDSANNNASSKYTISAVKHTFTAENADLNLASITGTADVTLKNTKTSGTVRKNLLMRLKKILKMVMILLTGMLPVRMLRVRTPMVLT